jgi:arabinofuranosyltransferase
LGFERSGEPPFTQMTADGRHVRDSGDAVAIRVAVGIFGYHAGPHVHIVDPYALGDAFLARLPAVRFGSWRIGHYYRVLPIGYVQSVKTGDNHLVDRDLAKLLDEIRLITEGPIFSGERWAAIWALNTGRLDGWVDSRFYQKPYYREVPDWALAEPVPNGHPWDAPATVRVHADHGLTIQLAEVGHQKRIDIAADHNDAYKLYFRLGDRVVGESKISKITDHKKVGLQSRDVQVPDTATEAGYDSIALVGSGRDTHLSIGHLVFAADRKRGRKSRAHQRRDGEARDEVEELDEAAQEAEQVEAADEDLQKVEAAQQ